MKLSRKDVGLNDADTMWLKLNVNSWEWRRVPESNRCTRICKRSTSRNVD